MSTPAPSLPLALRKDERDALPKRDENLKKISETLGGNWSVEIDNVGQMDTLIGKADSSYANRTFSLVYDSYLDALAYNFSRLDDSLVKAELLEQVSQKKIVVRADPNDKADGWHHTAIENGALVVISKPENMWTNISQVGEDVEKALNAKPLSANTLSLALRKDQAANAVKRDEHLAAISEAVGSGVKFTAEIEDPVGMQKAIDAEFSGYENRVFSCMMDGQLEGLKDNIKRLCADDLVKEELGKRLTGKILFSLDASVDAYHATSIGNDGTLHVKCHAKNTWTNLGQVGDDLESRL